MDADASPVRIELDTLEPSARQDQREDVPRRPGRIVGVAALLVVAVVAAGMFARAEPRDGDTSPAPSRPTGPVAPEIQNRAEELRRHLDEIGGLAATEIGTATGGFDLVTFDPLDPDRLFAAHRDGYGPAENQSVNEIWTITDQGVVQELWNPELAHDYVQFNIDGSATVWVHSGADDGYAARRPHVVAAPGPGTSPVAAAQPPAVYAARSVTVDGTVFALTGASDWYSRDERYRDVVAIRPDGVTRLVSADAFEWISAATPSIVVAYPASATGSIAVFDATSLEPVDDHPLAGRALRHAAISGDGTRAVGIRFDGKMEHIDLATGEIVDVFGSVEPAAIDRPIELDEVGSIAVTVSRSGDVDVWYVGDDQPIASIEGDIGVTRWLNDRRAARPASVIAPDASRVALRVSATPTRELQWTILETDPAAWVTRAATTSRG